MPAKTETLKIDKEFEGLCPKLSTEELEQLAANIESAGSVRDPICTWNDTIIDGHHRYKIAKRLGVYFSVNPMLFNAREDVIDWIIDNQLGRRNLDAAARRLLIGKKYNRVKGKAGRPGNSDSVSELIGGAAKYVADEHQVDPRSVERYGKEAESYDKLASGLKPKYEAGELCNVKQLHRLASMPKLDQVAAAKEVAAGKSWTSVLPPPERKPPKKTKASNNGSVKETSSAKVADNLIRNFCSPLVRGIDNLATAIGGKGTQHARANEALNELIGAIKEMRKGVK